MIRTTVAPRPRLTRPVRAGVAAASVIGIAALAGCAAGADDAATTPSESASSVPSASSPSASSSPAATESQAGSSADSTYADGTYSAEGSYATPESVETITVTVTLEDDVITDVEVTGDPQKRESEEYQGRFIGGISDVVVGKDIDEISVSRVAGSSLTSGGFNDAIETIKADAAA